MSAYYRHGETTMLDHISTGEIAGDVIDTGGGELGIVHSDTEAGRLGAVSAPNGNAVYEVDKASAATIYSIGDAFGTDGSSNAIVGTGFTCTKDSANGDPTVWGRFTG